MQVMRGAEAQGRPLLRPLLPRLGDPRDPRPAAAGVPGAHLLQRACSSAPGRSAGRACSATSASARRRASAGSSAEEHRAIVEDFCDFMAGQTDRVHQRLEKRDAGRRRRDQEYERAARLRDDIGALERAMEKQAVVLGDGTDADVIALAEDQLEAAVQVFYVRGGRVRGQRGWVVDKVEDVDTGDLVEQLPRSRSTAARPTRDAVPREVLVPALPDDADGAERVAQRPARRPGRRSGCRSAATRGRCWRPSRATPSRRWRCTRPGAPAT